MRLSEANIKPYEAKRSSTFSEIVLTTLTQNHYFALPCEKSLRQFGNLQRHTSRKPKPNANTTIKLNWPSNVVTAPGLAARLHPKSFVRHWGTT